jgi:hypothetical protein
MVKGENPPGLFVPAGPSHLPCAGWEDRQTLTSFVQSCAYNLDLPLSDVMAITWMSDVMAITWMSEKSNPCGPEPFLAAGRSLPQAITVNFRLAN